MDPAAASEAPEQPRPSLAPRSTIESWPDAESPASLDRRFPGIIDFVSSLAAAANVVLQLSWLAVGHGVVESRVESGQLFRRPFKRARTTFAYLAVALFGTREEKLAYRKAVTRVHAEVRSSEAAPVRYDALDPELQLWVAACLYFGIADAWRRLRGEPDAAMADALYRRLAPLGTTLQVRPEMWPADRAAFEAYWEAGLAKVRMDDAVRTYLLRLVNLEFLPRVVSLVLGPFHRFVTTGFLPPRVREELRLPWSDARERAFGRLLAVVSAVNRLLPRFVRTGPATVALFDIRRRIRRGRWLV